MTHTTVGTGRLKHPRRWSLAMRCFAVVITTYVAVLSGILLWSDGLPYILDGNENFSNLIHARNWVEFGTQVTHGLADESYGKTVESHPFIHTHQGNMPRLTATLLYAIGIHSPEAHIWLHVLLIGPLIMAAAYAFVLRLGGVWLATSACLALIFDYMFFIQWQANTYRIWAIFFITTGLVLAEYVNKHNLKCFSVLFFALFSLLFYGELVFAAFCSILLGIYIILRHYRQWRIVVLTGLSMAAGAATAIAVLILQLVGFYGRDNLIKDFTYTFLTRNLAADIHAIPKEVTDFFDRVPVVFFYNAQDQSALRTFDRFVESLFTLQVSVYHPAIFLFTTLVILFWIAQTFSSCSIVASRRLMGVDVARESPYILWLISVCYLAFELILNRSLDGYVIAFAPDTYGIIRSIVFTVACAFALIHARQWPMALLRAQEGANRRLLVSAAFGAVAAVCIGSIDGPFVPELAGFWRVNGGALAGLGLGLVGWVTVWAMMVALLFPKVGDFFPQIRIAPLLKFAFASALAYCAVFWASAGYVFSGYLYRGQSLLVFLWAIFFGMGFGILAHLVWQAFRRMCTIQRVEGNASVLGALRSIYRDVTVAASIGVAFVVGAWGFHQASYALALPPTQFAFVQTILGRPDMHGRTSVSNTYAAPFAYQMGNWSYADYRIGAGRVVWNGERWEPTLRSLSYLWFADRHSNETYLWPDFFICFVPTGLTGESQRRLGQKSPDCFDMPLVRQALEGRDAGVELVAAADTAPRRWAIVKFNWNKPPREDPETGASRFDK